MPPIGWWEEDEVPSSAILPKEERQPEQTAAESDQRFLYPSMNLFDDEDAWWPPSLSVSAGEEDVPTATAIMIPEALTPPVENNSMMDDGTKDGRGADDGCDRFR